MRPDPGRADLEAVLGDLGADERFGLGATLRERGIRQVWAQVDQRPPMPPVEEAMFVLGRLYPEMPEAHRRSLRRQMEAALEAGRWEGFERPGSP